MKTLLTIAALAGLSTLAVADIQDPPINDYGPTRKFGRGIANVAFAATELVQSPVVMNEREGNAAGFTYGVVKGIGRFFFRIGMGVYEITTHPFPTYKESYRPPYKSNVPWIHGGFEEFPPELGFETRLRYVRTYHGW